MGKKWLGIRLPPPHKKQREIEACTKKRVVVVAGRRAGKTWLASRKSIHMANKGRKVLYCAPHFAQTEAFWEMCVTWLWDAIQIGLVIKNETERSLRFVRGGGRIVAKTGSQPDNIRGTYADFLILDEYAYQNPDIWKKVGAPMLLDNNGTVWFISTGNKRNHFFLLALIAKADESGRWAFFQFPSTANPHLSKAAIEELAEDMTEEDYRQEILAEFVEGEGAVFRLVRDDFIPAPKWDQMVKEHAKHRIVGGLDWGRLHDYTCLSVGCSQCSKELMLRRFKKETYPAQRDIIKGLYTRLKEADMEPELLSESNAMGLPNLEQLREDGVPCLALLVQGALKAQLVQGLRLTFEQRAWKWVWSEQGWRELEGYEAKVTAKGNISYNAPEALHDDTIVARYMMLRQATFGSFTLGSFE